MGARRGLAALDAHRIMGALACAFALAWCLDSRSHHQLTARPNAPSAVAAGSGAVQPVQQQLRQRPQAAAAEVAQAACLQQHSGIVWQGRPNSTRALTRLMSVPGHEAQPTGFQARADWVIGSRHSHVRDPRCRQPAPAWGDPARAPRTVFVRSDLLARFAAHVLPCLSAPFVLLVGDSDQTTPRQLDMRYSRTLSRHAWLQLLADARVLHAFVENLDENPPGALASKVSGLPLGINSRELDDLPANFSTREERIDSMLAAAQQPQDLERRPLTVLDISRVRSGPQWRDRAHVAGLCRSRSWRGFCRHARSAPGPEYWALLANHSFVLCPHGGGLDPSPKAWEALLHGAIPIMQHYAGDDAYRQLPVVFVDAWHPEVLTARSLAQWRRALAPHFVQPDKRAEVLRRLQSQFWWAKVEAALEGRAQAMLLNASATELAIEWREPQPH